MLEIKNLTYEYQNEKFCFNFNAKCGQVTAIQGKSGAGKSTLLSLMAGFLKPSDGDILLFEKSLIDKRIDKRDLSILFQDNNLFEHLSIYDNIALGINTKLKITPVQKDEILAQCKKFEIQNLLNKLPSEVSGGQKQRAALCRTILRKKKILLLDEPFSALDKKLKDELLMQILQITKEQDICTIMVTHFKEDALKIASKIITIENGNIIKEKSNIL